jgi:hypothetical protein
VLALIIALADTFAAPPARLALSPVSTGKRRGMKNPLLTQSFSTAA